MVRNWRPPNSEGLYVLTKTLAFACKFVNINFGADDVSKWVEGCSQVSICQVVRQVINKQVRPSRTLTRSRIGRSCVRTVLIPIWWRWAELMRRIHVWMVRVRGTMGGRRRCCAEGWAILRGEWVLRSCVVMMYSHGRGSKAWVCWTNSHCI